MSYETVHERTDIFVSYASQDRPRVVEIVKQLQNVGISVWFDRASIPGGASFAYEIASGIKKCTVFVLMCSDASLRSRNVKAEIQLAWKYDRRILPLLLEPVSFPQQLEYWLEGWQWIEIMQFPPTEWLPSVLKALVLGGVVYTIPEALKSRDDPPRIHDVIPSRPTQGLSGLLRIAQFTDQIWPIPASTSRNAVRGLRGLGAPQEHAQHQYELGSQVRLVIESDREGYLLLLDEGPEEIIYCLCPSKFAPDTHLQIGRSELPQTQSPYDSFILTGQAGIENLLAIITEQPLDLPWMSINPRFPAYTLGSEDLDSLISQLQTLMDGSWIAMSTYFRIIART